MSIRRVGSRAHRRPTAVVAGWALTVLAPAVLAAQDAPDEWVDLLARVMPEADRFSDRQGRPPVFEAYRTDASTGGESLIGYAFLTSDLPPEQKGFTGPIEVLVGMDVRGVLTGIVVTHYTESHQATRGDFLAADGFQEQFRGKNIADAFRVRRDVDGITGATISVDAMSRGVRNAARVVAAAHDLGSMSGVSEAPALDPVSVSTGELDELSWPQMLLRGLGQQISVLDDGRTVVDLTLFYLRDDSVAQTLIGPGPLAEVRDRGALTAERHLVLATVDGPSAGALNLARLSIIQESDTVAVAPDDVLLFGQPREGKLDGQVRMFRVVLVDRSVDMKRPFTFALDLRPGLDLFTADYPGEREGGVSRTLSGVWSRVLLTCMVLGLMLGTAVFVARRP